MDDNRFDLLTRSLGRRGAARLLLGLAGLVPAVVAVDEADAGVILDFCEIKSKGERCRRDSQCCSHDCKRKKGKKRGKCRCSPLGAACAQREDCCPPVIVNAIDPICAQRGMSIEAVCCMPGGGHCSVNSDCCGEAACTGGNCES